ncbi:hypothetical protein OF83DRAFT_1190458 [Amylostereum chailletii]|nr:hypothetical protein OF83DRAFT_1190458 [Amylostereum chailletii]
MQSTSPRASRHPATSPVRRKPVAMPGFRVPPKPKPRPIEELTIRELRDLYDRNTRILAQPAPSTSSYVPRLQAEQTRIQSRLLDLEGIEQLGSAFKHTKLRGEDDMSVDSDPEPVTSRMLEAKRQLLYSSGVRSLCCPCISLQQAIQMEQEAQAQDRERKQRQLDKRLKHGLPMEGERLTREEREARLWAFMNHKPTDSDLEDDDDDDDNDDPATWFEDDQDDGRKGQDIIEPDPEGLSDVIRIDESKINYTFYEPRER